MWKERCIFLCMLAALLLACGGEEENNTSNETTNEMAGDCEGKLPDGSASVMISGDQSDSASITLDCGDPAAPNGLFTLHAPPTAGDPLQLQLTFSKGESDWVLRVSSEIETIEPGTYDLLADPAEGFGTFNIPRGTQGELYNVSAGSMTIDEVDELSLGGMSWLVLSGSVDATLEGVTATVSFEDIPVRPFMMP